MKPIASRLPFEVVDIINSYLCDQERATCMSVCRHWYLIFKQFLFKDIVISDYAQFQSLYRLIDRESNTLDGIGSHVRSICFESFAIALEEEDEYELFCYKMSRLSILCPNISSFGLPIYRIACVEESELSLLLSPFSLTHLSVTSNKPFRLMHWPHLQHVQLEWMTATLQTHHLEQLFLGCPTLTTLRISASRVILDFRADTIQPAVRLTQFTMESQHYIEAIESVFSYAACKYPSLRRLSIRSGSATLPSSDLEDVGTHLLNRYSAYVSFVQRCNYIDTLAFKNIVPDPVLLDAMRTMRVQLKKFEIDTIFGMSRSAFEVLVHTLHESVTDLCVNSSVRVKNTRDGVGALLRPCKQLTRLEIGKQSVVYADGILDQCPRLRRLAFYDTLVSANQRSNTLHTQLKELVLDKVAFSQDLVDQVSRQCPGMARLNIINAVYLSEQLKLTLSAHVKIKKLYLNARNREVRYFALTNDTNGISNWYQVEGNTVLVADKIYKYQSIVLICSPNVRVYLANDLIVNF